MVKEGKLREDFYYRINVVPVHLPPLRERLEDIPLLVTEFLRNNPLAREKSLNRLSDKALNQLTAYDWQGNIRELYNVMERAILRAKGDTIRDVDVPTGIRASRQNAASLDYALPLREYLKGAEREYLARLLAQYQGGIAPCARHASVDQATLHRKIKTHGLKAGDYRHNGRNASAGS
jgi:transcriptional regulator with PAS, ATPase and Fis domain